MGADRQRRLLDIIGEPATVVGRDTVLHGSLSGGAHCLVEGTVIGDSELEGAVTLAEGGRWEGRLAAGNAVVAGRLDGDLEVGGKLEIRASARISGTVRGRQVAIAEGAVIEGGIEITGAAEARHFREKRHP